MAGGALVVFSGGQDSATCLAWALERHDHVETIGFDYGQRHRVELDVRADFREAITTKFPQWADRLGPDHMLALPSLAAISDTALTSEREIAFNATGLPNTFVPGRNLLFLTYAAAVAYRRGLKHLVTGVCETDFSGYPDCRDDTMKLLQVTLNLGTESRFVIDTPLMWIDKAQTWDLANDLGGELLVNLVIEHTHTCYLGDRTRRHPWGYGCGTCPACDLRAAGFEKWNESRNVQD
ncbi:7-cyano-7-deazaguanine synthase QueC [Caulobacter sp. SL161]|uniref:7-cyano-7-deazaguanine synthase QueC n=1 Tax=Caulobacter sp. SL161 TaxID=2995156 RepID=UPI00227402CF|nr:7-cyano-7-deazaguanine synthase QueC [Caulobacter sp. SL161]MCY1646668.1 7-cyano-7-deazaguanine synthase QueC [Caulobacter sp. SL161]